MSYWALETTSPLLISQWTEGASDDTQDQQAPQEIIAYQPGSGDLHVLGTAGLVILRNLDRQSRSLSEITATLNELVDDDEQPLDDEEVLQQYLDPLRQLQLIREL